MGVGNGELYTFVLTTGSTNQAQEGLKTCWSNVSITVNDGSDPSTGVIQVDQYAFDTLPPLSKVDYCHVDATGAVHLISISPNAIPAHDLHNPLDHFPNESTGLCRDCPCNTVGTYFNDLFIGAEGYDDACVATFTDNTCTLPVEEGTRFGVDTDDGKVAGVVIGYTPAYLTGCIRDAGDYTDLFGQEDNAQFCLDLLATVVTEFQEV